MAERFIADEAQRAAIGAPVVIEETGSVTLQNIGFTLTAKPDRVDLLEDGTLQIYDYKSGKIPSQKEVLHFDKQLLLEAGIAARGGFAGLGPRETSGMTYIGLGREAKVQAVDQTKETIEQAWAKFEQLMARYLDPDQRYTARRAMMTSDQTSDYDHLSRFGEWELSDLPEDAQ
jgi:ATP-dependent helicase/nuclease subunit B